MCLGGIYMMKIKIKNPSKATTEQDNIHVSIPASSTNKTDRRDITEILLRLTLYTLTLTPYFLSVNL